MLMSLSILKDPNFLSTQYHNNFDIRMKVINAVKFVAGGEFFDRSTADDSCTLEEYARTLLGGPKDTASTMDKLAKRRALWSKYAWPVYPLMYLENTEQGYLFEQRSANEYTMMSMFRDGKKCIIMSELIVLRRLESGELKLFTQEFADTLIEPVLEAMRKAGAPEEQCTPEYFHYHCQQATYKIMVATMEALLFLNMKNVRLHLYKPNKREYGPGNKAFYPRYTYRVLDVHRERVRYVSLGEILSDISKDREVLRRAHLVRGHHKEKYGKLYWWNAHVRNARNAESHGTVEKVYRLKGPPQLSLPC